MPDFNSPRHDPTPLTDSAPAAAVVLFVCTGNYYRSRFAELYFNAAAPAELGWRALSRGFAPSPANPGFISSTVLSRLAARGFALPAEHRLPAALSDADLERSALIIALDEVEHRPYVRRLFAAWEDRFRYWSIPDVGLLSAAEALEQIEQHIDALIREILLQDSLPAGQNAML